ncbi:MAG: enoyl-CoA hydratase-related protein [Dehalococcoidia bacterium]|jgi:enoyl-CoA hydratase/carnithine racemase
MKYKALRYKKNGRTAELILDIPGSDINSHECVCAELLDFCKVINCDDSISVVVLRHTGRKFLGDIATEPGSPVCEVIESVARLDKITVAVIDGDAFGEGLELALACDIRIASARSRFALPNVENGTIPSGGGTQRLPRLVGQAKTLELILTAKIINAAEAFRIGLIQKIVPSKNIKAESDTLVQKIDEKAPVALRFCKEAVNKGVDLTLEQGLRLEADLYFLIQTTSDRMEGINSFLQKRRPSFKGE